MSRPLLYDASGRVIRRAQDPAWPAAGTGRRVRNWYPTSSSINDLIAQGGVGLMRERSRQEERRNPYAQRALEIDTAYVIGTGITPKPMIQDDATERIIVELWEDFVENSDADGVSDFYGQQALAYHGATSGGDAFIRVRPRRANDGLRVPLQLQVLEAEQCDETQHLDLGNGRVIRAGIEFDQIGRRAAYWMYPSHPGESLGPKGSPRPVPADQIIHLFRVLRPGQVRGIPKLASVLGTLKEIEDARDARVLKMKIANLYVSWEYTPTPEVSVFDTSEGSEPVVDDAGEDGYSPEPGDHHVLPDGRRVEFSQPPKDSDDFAAFFKLMLRTVAAGAGCTYEQVSQDLEGVNFSSIRTGLVMLRRLIEPVQRHMVIFQLCRPVWRRFMETIILAGLVKIPKDQLGLALRAKWQTPAWEYVEPEKDIRTAVRKIRAGVWSRERECLAQAIDVEELDREIARDNARAKANGLIFDSDAGATSQAGVGHAGGTVPATLQQLDDEAQQQEQQEASDAAAA